MFSLLTCFTPLLGPEAAAAVVVAAASAVGATVGVAIEETSLEAVDADCVAVSI
jgi:hypothetical protein